MAKCCKASSRHIGIGLAGATGSATADSLNPFTFAPGQVGLAGDTFTADNLVLSNNSTVRQTTASTFSDEGSFIVNAAQLVTSTSFVPHGLSSTYGLYIAFSGNGTTDSPGVDSAHKPTSSTFTDLSYTMYGYKGSASFGFQSDNAPTTSINGGAVMTPTSTPPLGAVVKLASGSFIQGFAGTSPSKPSFSPSGSLDLTLTTDYMNAKSLCGSQDLLRPGKRGFLEHGVDGAQFSDAQGQGFRITQGSGTVNFSASAVPEPGTYAMLLAGLGLIGFVAGRRLGRGGR